MISECKIFILPRKIKQNDAITRKLVFGTANSKMHLLNLVDYDDTIILSRTVNVDELREIH